MNYHQTVSKIIDVLNKNNIWYETFEHQPVRTSEEAAKIRSGYSLKQGAKALIIRIKISQTNKKFVMIVIPGDKKFDESKIKKLYGAKDIRFADEDEVLLITDGVLPGGVPPFGNIFGLEVIADPLIFENKKIIFNAGDKRFSIGMYSNDYKNIVKPIIQDIT